MRRIAMTEREDFELANRAFELFTIDEREKALRHFAGLRYPSITARFFDAVDFVIKGKADPLSSKPADET